MLDRYSRQTLFAPIGKDGQERLLHSSIAIIGCGALGTGLANNLCRSGIGKLSLADRDFIELNNLQRQILFDEDDVHRHVPKAIAAVEKLQRINRDITLEAIVEDVTLDCIETIVCNHDLILDATDNFETRYLINDACIKHQRPWIYSGVISAYGTTMNILPGETACLRCVFPDMPLPGTTPTCDTVGVLNGIVAAITGIAATEAIKILLHSEKRSRALVAMDVWENTLDHITLPQQPDCIACGQHHYEFLDGLSTSGSTTLCGRNAVQIRGYTGPTKHKQSIDFSTLAERLTGVGEVHFNQHLLQFRVDGYELTVFPDARAIIKGTDNEQVARTLYARYIGA
jgi:molybdopterin-synthase adenylyltransferase